MTVDLGALSRFSKPALLTQGDQSPPFFAVVLDKVAGSLPQARRHTYVGAGHTPHMTHPEEYGRVLTSFVAA